LSIDWMLVASGEHPPHAPHRLDVPEPWDEDRTKFKPRLYLRADTWAPPPIHPAAPLNLPPPGSSRPDPKVFLPSPDGTMGLLRTVLRKHQWLRLGQGARRGWACFDGNVEIPCLWKVRGGRYDDVWMSYTPMEIMTQRKGVMLAKGTVVIGGLGLGWLLRKVHAKPSVRRVVVVEQSAALLDWYGRDLCAGLPKVSDVICGDVREHYGKHGDARYLIDIWESYGDAPGKAELDARKAGCRIWCWGEYSS
jgi:hypothetical protein